MLIQTQHSHESGTSQPFLSCLVQSLGHKYGASERMTGIMISLFLILSIVPFSLFRFLMDLCLLLIAKEPHQQLPTLPLSSTLHVPKVSINLLCNGPYHGILFFLRDFVQLIVFFHDLKLGRILVLRNNSGFSGISEIQQTGL